MKMKNENRMYIIITFGLLIALTFGAIFIKPLLSPISNDNNLNSQCDLICGFRCFMDYKTNDYKDDRSCSCIEKIFPFSDKTITRTCIIK